jgi:antitoxin VapB
LVYTSRAEEVAVSEKTAKLFPNGRSQAVRLPVSCRFEGDEVYVRKDPETGEVILSAVPNSWDGFFELREASSMELADFLADRGDTQPQSRVPLDAVARNRRR